MKLNKLRSYPGHIAVIIFCILSIHVKGQSTLAYRISGITIIDKREIISEGEIKLPFLSKPGQQIRHYPALSEADKILLENTLRSYVKGEGTAVNVVITVEEAYQEYSATAMNESERGYMRLKITFTDESGTEIKSCNSSGESSHKSPDASLKDIEEAYRAAQEDAVYNCVHEIEGPPAGEYKPVKDTVVDPRVNCISIGFLHGGGSLVGFDFEALLVKRFGVQVGAGFIGYGAGLNLHLKPQIRSSFFSLQYLHQGFENTYVQTIVGPAFVYRGKKWLTGQLGFGFVTDRGPAFPAGSVQVPVVLTYSLGAYFPF